MVANESKRDEALAKISKATGEKYLFPYVSLFPPSLPLQPSLPPIHLSFHLTVYRWTFDEKCLETMWTEGYEKNPDWERYKTQVGGFWYKEALTNLANNIETVCFFPSPLTLLLSPPSTKLVFRSARMTW